MPTPSAETTEALRRARLLALDVDGTLTDGRVVYKGKEEIQSFCVLDGQGLVWLAEAGVKIAWISGRGCKATERRASELRIDEVHLRAGPKSEVLESLQERLRIGIDETVAMGDDIPDLGLAERAGVFAAPANARPEVRERADIVTTASGGSGAVRELVEAMLEAKGMWRARVERRSP